MQIAGYTAMAAVIYELALLRLGAGPWPVVILAAVLLSPTKDAALSTEMGNTPFLPLLIVLAVLYTHRRRPLAFTLVLVVILLSREDAAPMVAGLAIYAWWTAGWRRLAGAALLGSAAWTVLLLKVVMPRMSAAHTAHTARLLTQAYMWLGGSASEVQRDVGHRFGRAWEHVSLRSVADSRDLWCDDWNVPLAEEYLLIESPRPSPEIRHLLAASPYGVVFNHHDVVLLRRDGDRSANQALALWAIGDAREAFQLPRQIGAVFPDTLARSGQAVRAPRGMAGLVVYGFYADACSGSHTLVARIRGGPRRKAGELGRLELRGPHGAPLLAAHSLDLPALDPGEYREIGITLSLPKATPVEARIYSSGAGAFWVDALTLAAVSASRAVEPPGERCEAPAGSRSP